MKIVKKIFLMGLSSILSLGVISSSNLGYASYIGTFNPIPKGKEDKYDLTRVDPKEWEGKRFSLAKRLAFATMLYRDVGEEVDEILEKIGKGKLGKIRDRKYKLPDAEEFITGSMVNSKLLNERIEYWNNMIKVYRMQKEKELLDKIFNVINSYLNKFGEALDIKLE